MKRRPVTKAYVEAIQYSRMFPPGTMVEVCRPGFDGIATTIKGHAFARNCQIFVELTGFAGAFPVSVVNAIN